MRARQLQAGGIRIDYVIGVTDPDRAAQAEQTMATLSSGKTSMIENFAQELDKQLVKRGKEPIKLEASSFKFGKPKKSVKASANGATGDASKETGSTEAILLNPLDSSSTTIIEKRGDDGKTIIIVGVLLGK